MYTEKRLRKKAASFGAVLLAAVQVMTGVSFLPTAARAEEEPRVLHLYTARELEELAENCHDDAWSRGLTVYLENDVDLKDSAFTQIPIFNGTFDGQGHNISGYTYGGTGYVTGLFRYVGPFGEIRELSVTGSVTAGGEQQCTGGIVGINQGRVSGCRYAGSLEGKDTTGGIVGINQADAVISRCGNSARVTGYYYTGGIAGKNYGQIDSCYNNGFVNDSTAWVEGDDELAGGILTELTKQKEDLIAIRSGLDTGGIAGYSAGVIRYCSNKGTVGYEHVGYNVGGIVGRQCGTVRTCVSRGKVYGKRDVGGIVGQQEPYVEQNSADSIRNSIEKIHTLAQRAASDARDAGSELSRDLNTLAGASAKAVDAAGTLANDTGDAASGAVSAMQRAQDEIAGIGEGIETELEEGPDSPIPATNIPEDTDLPEDPSLPVPAVDTPDLPDTPEVPDVPEVDLPDAQDLPQGAEEAADQAQNAAQEAAGQAQEAAQGAAEQAQSAAQEAAQQLQDAVEEIIKHDAYKGTSAQEAAGALQDAAQEAAGQVQETQEGLQPDAPSLPDVTLPDTPGLPDAPDVTLPDPQDLPQTPEEASGQAQAAAQDAAQQIQDALGGVSADAQAQAQDALAQAQSALSGAGVPQLPNFAGSIQTGQLSKDMDSLLSQLNSMSAALNAVNAHSDRASGILGTDIDALNDQMNRTYGMMSDLVSGIESEGLEYLFTDISEDAATYTAFGRTLGCTNSGIVRADLHVGGICGSLGVDEENLETNVIKSFRLAAGERYLVSNVVYLCTNRGIVTGRSECVGGIVGDMTQGYVGRSYGYGGVESLEGDYVGGIAGKSEGTIADSYVLSSITGHRNIGGIAGYATRMKRCTAMPVFPSYDGICGAVAGQISRDQASERMSTLDIRDNLYVSDEVYGIDDISYEGCAQQISYEDLLARPDTPGAFSKLTITFRAGDSIVSTAEAEYGSLMSALEFPEIPAEADAYGEWPEFTDENVDGNLVVDAVYTSYRHVLESEQTDEATGKPLALVGGLFTGRDALTALPASDPFEPSDGSSYTDLRILRVELEAPDEEGEETAQHTLRLYTPFSDPKLWILENGTWNRVSFEEKGQYLQLPMTGSTALYCITQSPDLRIRKILLGVAAGVVVLVLIILIVKLRRVAKSHDPKGEEEPEEEPEAKPDDEEA